MRFIKTARTAAGARAVTRACIRACARALVADVGLASGSAYPRLATRYSLRRQSHRTYTLTGALTCAIFALVSPGVLAAQSSMPLDLSGTWILNTAKSDFDITDPKGDTSTYTRSGNVYVVMQRSDAGKATYQWPVGAGNVTSDLPEGAKECIPRPNSKATPRRSCPRSS